ncbi:class I SAM-dependent methyltransferase [Phenylobacterium sp.]|uniref:class I SAM-dependent methyltransferase n=1 Tax=Phenylobacterium sp. TaxID=1871053 RepID=UPI00271B65BF|nr:class I SAM-dependent methyltransferase [Phenylobacterium sp.]MDO8381151.1 class I SAM-dependent methyltransferase [Phenylobacterium sp.]
MTYAEEVAAWIKARVARDPPLAKESELSTMLRVLAIWRSRSIAATLARLHDGKILNGPFAGMDYVKDATEGALAPRLLGSYESELHPTIARFAAEGFDCVIDVGCAEGYYAVGLARLMPQVTVYAYDIVEKARIACAELAAKNGVEDRLIIGELFTPTGFEAFADRKCLVMMDVEGAEDDLLRPDLSPALAQMSLIVETHDVYKPGVLERLRERFSATHDIQRLDQGPKTTPLPDWLARLGHLDHLLAVWEWRIKPTPWLVMTPKAQA